MRRIRWFQEICWYRPDERDSDNIHSMK